MPLGSIAISSKRWRPESRSLTVWRLFESHVFATPSTTHSNLTPASSALKSKIAERLATGSRLSGPEVIVGVGRPLSTKRAVIV